MGIVEKLYIVAEKRGSVTEVEEVQLEAGKGIVGDRYHNEANQLMARGKPARKNHISFIAREELENFLQTHDSDLGFGDFRRSVITSGIDLNALVGRQFTVGDAVCYGYELCEPCAYLASSVHKAVLPGLVNKGGLRATIVGDGKISIGSAISKK